jgi:hypothetical protein
MIRFITVPLTVVLLSCQLTTAGTIDLFQTSQDAETDVMAPPPQGVGTVANPAATALGGERDLFVNKVLGDDGQRLRARVNPLGASKLRVDSDTEVQGSVFVTWDGPDGNPSPFSGIDFNGLGGIDLTQGGTFSGLDLTVSFSDIGGTAKLSIFDNAANSAASVATRTINIPGGIPTNTPTPFTFNFSDFAGTTSALTDAGAMLLELQDSNGGWDVNIVSLTQVPEPSSALLSCLGAMILLMRFRSRNR